MRGQVIAGAVGAAVAIATPFIAGWEGKRNLTYNDVVGIPTVCYGRTGDAAIPGKRYTDEQCKVMLREDVQKYMGYVRRCTPLVSDPHQLAAATSLTFNIGGAAYCRSTVARRFNDGDNKGACDAFLMWRFAGGREIPGLLNRRKAERALCLKGVA